MDLNDVRALLHPAPLALETGFERLPSGVLHVACRTDLPRCTGDMFEWWFRSRPDTERYLMWHPVDHLASSWAEGSADTHVGSIHLAEEFFSGMPSEQLAIQFRDPREFFDAEQYAAARADGRISAAVCARVGMSYAPPRTADGAVIGGRLLHMGRDTAWGMTLRSHFYMGQDLPDAGHSPQEIAALFSDEFARALLMHCYNEFTFLSQFLRSHYQAKHRDSVPVALPW